MLPGGAKPESTGRITDLHQPGINLDEIKEGGAVHGIVISDDDEDDDD